jgi:putative FmdB family regulatory protein
VPTYQYACTDCDYFFEEVQAFTDDALTVCPQCAGRLRKVFNAVGVVFKGSGFYRTDSRSSAERSAAAKDSKPPSEKSDSAAQSESTTKSDKTPAAAGSSSASSSTTKSDAAASPSS